MHTFHGEIFSNIELEGFKDLSNSTDSENAFKWRDLEWKTAPADTMTFLRKLIRLQVVVENVRLRPSPKQGVMLENVWDGWCFRGDNFEEFLDFANSPPIDNLANLKNWFWGKKWSIPVYLILWGVPLVAGWALAIQNLMKWFGFP